MHEASFLNSWHAFLISSTIMSSSPVALFILRIQIAFSVSSYDGSFTNGSAVRNTSSSSLSSFALYYFQTEFWSIWPNVLIFFHPPLLVFHCCLIGVQSGLKSFPKPFHSLLVFPSVSYFPIHFCTFYLSPKHLPFPLSAYFICSPSVFSISFLTTSCHPL